MQLILSCLPKVSKVNDMGSSRTALSFGRVKSNMASGAVSAVSAVNMKTWDGRTLVSHGVQPVHCCNLRRSGGTKPHLLPVGNILRLTCRCKERQVVHTVLSAPRFERQLLSKIQEKNDRLYLDSTIARWWTARNGFSVYTKRVDHRRRFKRHG